MLPSVHPNETTACHLVTLLQRNLVIHLNIRASLTLSETTSFCPCPTSKNSSVASPPSHGLQLSPLSFFLMPLDLASLLRIIPAIMMFGPLPSSWSSCSDLPHTYGTSNGSPALLPFLILPLHTTNAGEQLRPPDGSRRTPRSPRLMLLSTPFWSTSLPCPSSQGSVWLTARACSWWPKLERGIRFLAPVLLASVGFEKSLQA